MEWNTCGVIFNEFEHATQYGTIRRLNAVTIYHAYRVTDRVRIR